MINIITNIKTDKALGWACIPRALGQTDDNLLINSIIKILENIMNTGIFPNVFNCTRLVALNKVPNQIPELKNLRPIQIADIIKVYFESLA